MYRLNKIFVSVIMPVFNGSEFLDDAINSILNQTHKNFEFLIIDNFSTDQSENIILNHIKHDNRIKLIKESNKGIAYALNKGISYATGNYIFRMDCDDISETDRFEQTLKYMINNDLDICGSFIKKFGKNKNLIKYPIHNNSIRHAINFCSPFAHPTICFNSRIKKHIYYENKVAEDLILWKKLSLQSEINFGNVPMPLLKYRTHSSQTINTQEYTNTLKIEKSEIKYNLNLISNDTISLNDKLFITRNYIGKLNLSILEKVIFLFMIILKHFYFKWK